MQSIKETCPKKKVSKAEIDLIVFGSNGEVSFLQTACFPLRYFEITAVIISLFQRYYSHLTGNCCFLPV